MQLSGILAYFSLGFLIGLCLLFMMGCAVPAQTHPSKDIRLLTSDLDMLMSEDPDLAGSEIGKVSAQFSYFKDAAGLCYASIVSFNGNLGTVIPVVAVSCNKVGM